MFCLCWCIRYQCPDHVNPAEFLADLISVDYSSAESVDSSQRRIDELIEEFSRNTPAIQCVSPVITCKESKVLSELGKKSVVKRRGGWWRQFWLLLKRAWMQVSVPIFSPPRLQNMLDLNMCTRTCTYERKRKKKGEG